MMREGTQRNGLQGWVCKCKGRHERLQRALYEQRQYMGKKLFSLVEWEV